MESINEQTATTDQENSQSAQQVNEPAAEKTYPTEPDTEGFFFENQDDEENGIFTKIYPNDNKIKKAFLQRSAVTAIVRELTGKDSKEISRYMGKDTEKYKTASLTVATTINGTKQTFEFFDDLKQKDLNKLLSMHQDLNF